MKEELEDSAVELFEFDDEFQEWQEEIDEAEQKLSKEALLEPVTALPLRDPTTLPAGASVIEAVDLLVRESVGAVLVVREGHLEGIFSERDLLRLLSEPDADLSATRVDQVMTREPQSLRADNSIADALSLMHRGGYRHVPIVDEERRPVGIVSVRDIVGYIVDYFPQEVLNLPPHPLHRGAREREGA